MSESWKQTITSVSSVLFPNLVYYHPCRETDFVKLGNEVLSNLPLQMSLFFNITFYPVWLITNVAMLSIKYKCLGTLDRFVIVTIFLFAVIVECLRLYLGYIGNLTERIPELAGFWILSFLLQLPAQLFLLVYEGTLPQPIEKIVQSVMLIMLIIQLLVGFSAVHTAANHQARHFHVMKIQSLYHSTSNLDVRLKSE